MYKPPLVRVEITFNSLGSLYVKFWPYAGKEVDEVIPTLDEVVAKIKAWPSNFSSEKPHLETLADYPADHPGGTK